MKPVELEDRLIQFSINIILFCKTVKNNFEGDYLTKQLIRSASSSALNYGEARSAESTRDFSHKLKTSLKELRECMINLKIQKGANLTSGVDLLEKLLKENNELISIFVVSIKTSSAKLNIKFK
jgi:four helix bundle protein